MKRIIHISLLLIAVLQLVSCDRNQVSIGWLRQFDSLVWIAPDSSLHLLENIHPRGSAQRAYHALLLTQARYRCYIPQPNDSLIQTAIRYYEQKSDAPHLLRAYYYLGGIYEENGQPAEALKAYYHALHLAEMTDDAFWKGKTYNCIAYLYYSCDLNEKSDSISQKAINAAQLSKDTIVWAESLIRLANTNIYQKNGYIEAEQYLMKTNQILEKTYYPTLEKKLAEAFSSLYSHMNNAEKALVYAKKYTAYQNGGSSYHTFSLLGDANFKLGVYDSAHYYYRKLLESPITTHQLNAYMRLADIAKKQDSTALSLQLERKYSALLKDRTNEKQNSSNDLLDAEKEILLQLQDRNHNSMHPSLYLLIALTAVTATILFAIRKNHLHKHDTNAEQQIQVLQEERQALIQMVVQDSEAYNKIQQILADHKAKGFSKESLTNEEWLSLQAEADPSGTIDRLRQQHQLTSKEVHLCILLLFNFSVVDIARICGITRQTIYRTEKNILSKLGQNTQGGMLQKLLKQKAI